MRIYSADRGVTIQLERLIANLRPPCPAFHCRHDLQRFTHLRHHLIAMHAPTFHLNQPIHPLNLHILTNFKRFVTFLFGNYPFRWTLLDINGISRKTRRNYSKSEYLEFVSLFIPDQIRKLEDWRKLEYKVIKEFHGNALLENGTILTLLRESYPMFAWEKVWRFPTEAGGPERRAFVDRFLLEFFPGVWRQQDLASVASRAFSRPPGGSTMLHLAGSPESAFQETYPELLPKFGRVSRGFWGNLKQFFELISKTMKQFEIRSKEDWYRLSDSQVSSVFGSKVPKSKLVKVLRFLLPEEEWEYVKFAEKINKRSRQKWLGVKLKELYGNELIFEDHVVKFGKRTCVFDFYLPGRKFVVEYQGEQHYFSVLKWMTLEEQWRRDEEKRGYCLEKGLGVVCVPYWWDGGAESLMGIIKGELEKKEKMQRRIGGKEM